jgi:Tol biopolymer transport system component
VGEQDGVDYLVMEYIEGETLAEMLKKGVLVGALIATVLSSVVFLALMQQSAPRVSRTSISTPPSQPISLSFFDSDLAISPDGTRIVYVGRAENGERQLFIRRLDRYEAEALDGTGPAPRNPFFSADGSWVGYVDTVRPGRLRKVSSLGGLPITICEVSAFRIRGASWGSDDNIIFASLRVSGACFAFQQAAESQKFSRLPEQIQKSCTMRGSELLPGGKAVLYTAFSQRYQPDTATIEVLSLETGERKTLVSGASNPHYATSGHILYGAQSAVRAMRFDLDRLEVRGAPVSVVERVRMNFSGAVNFDVALDGSFVYISGTTTGIDTSRQLVWVNRDGTEEPIAVDTAAYNWARVSPDGTRLAVSLTDKGSQDVWIHELARGTLSRLTTDPKIDNLPLWTPDGEGVVFASLRAGPQFSVFLQAADGTGRAKKLVTSEVIGNFLPFAWSRDPTHWPSGEKNGSRALSVPGNGIASNWSSERR